VKREWTAPADAEHLPVLRNAVGAYARDAGLPPKVVSDVKLAVSEIVTNAIIHGYEDRSGTITVGAEVTDQLVVTVTDDGPGMLPRTDSPGVGLGLPIVGKITASFGVTTPAAGRGTEVRMTFRLTRRGGRRTAPGTCE